MWESRSIEIAGRIVRGLYPLAQDLPADTLPGKHPVVLRTDAWLEANTDAPRALRRIVVEQRSHLLRALTAQAVVHGNDRSVTPLSSPRKGPRVLCGTVRGRTCDVTGAGGDQPWGQGTRLSHSAVPNFAATRSWAALSSASVSSDCVAP